MPRRLTTSGKFEESDAPRAADWLLATALAIAFTLSVVDRYVLAFVVPDVQRDLGLSDLQVGMLQGFAFSLVFGIAGLPLGHLVDRVSRTRLVAAAIAVWSVMTLGCGLARSYALLVLCRCGVGTGEAALTPAAYSMLSQAFPPRYFFVASAIFSVGPVLAVSAAAALTALVLRQADPAGLVQLAWIGPVAAWRAVFLLCGLLGLPLVLAFLFLREPRRESRGRDTDDADGLRDFAGFVRRNWQVHGVYCVASGLTTAASYALNAWMPATLGRDLGWGPDRLGSALASLALVSGLIGCAVAGATTSLLARHGRTADLFLCVAVAAAVFAGAGAAITIARDDGAVLPLLFVAYLVSPLLFVLAPSLLQLLTPERFRGRMSALFLLVNVGLGAGLGPVLVGALSSSGVTGASRLGSALGWTIAILCTVAAALAAASRSRFAKFADGLVAAGAGPDPSPFSPQRHG